MPALIAGVRPDNCRLYEASEQIVGVNYLGRLVKIMRALDLPGADESGQRSRRDRVTPMKICSMDEATLDKMKMKPDSAATEGQLGGK